jgi:hypothetical protein
MESSGCCAGLLRPTDHQLRLRPVVLAHCDCDWALIAEDPTSRPPGSRLIATGDKPDLRVGSASERDASDHASSWTIARGDRHRHWGFSLHYKWRLRHQDRAGDLPLFEPRETRKPLLLSRSKVTASSVDAEAANRSRELAPVRAGATGSTHRAAAGSGLGSLGDRCVVGRFRLRSAASHVALPDCRGVG